jgi:hypothetical protein
MTDEPDRDMRMRLAHQRSQEAARRVTRAHSKAAEEQSRHAEISTLVWDAIATAHRRRDDALRVRRELRSSLRPS